LNANIKNSNGTEFDALVIWWLWAFQSCCYHWI